MSSQQDRKPIPPVEVSQKFMAWNIKEISESLKAIEGYIATIASACMKQMPRSNGSPQVRTMHDRSEEVPF